MEIVNPNNDEVLDQPILCRIQEWLVSLKGCKYRLVVGLSGGVDSVVLLHALQTLIGDNNNKFDLVALHINHNMQLEADSWVEFVNQFCERYKIRLLVEKVDIGQYKGTGLEAAARRARYRVFAKHIGLNDVLLLAHHKNDQAETLLLRILRGTGLDGLSAIPVIRAIGTGVLYRPLLNTSRESIVNYANKYQLTWVQDPSNFDDSLDRSYLRQHLFPLLARRWPHYLDSFAKTTELCADSKKLLNSYVAEDYQRVTAFNQSVLLIDLLRSFSAEKIKAILRYYFNARLLSVPEKKQLELIVDKFLSAKKGTIGSWKNTCVYTIDQYLVAYRQLPTITEETSYIWQGESSIFLPGSQLYFNNFSQFSGELVIKFRQGGETFYSNNMKKSLKKFFQSEKVLPWWRSHLPLIYYNDRLIAIADWWFSDEFEQLMSSYQMKIRWTPTDIVKLK